MKQFWNWLIFASKIRNLSVTPLNPIFFLILYMIHKFWCTSFILIYIYINLSKHILYLINIYTYIFPILQNARIIFLLISISRSSNRSFPITNETHAEKNRNSRFSMHDVVYLWPIRYMASRSPCLDRN